MHFVIQQELTHYCKAIILHKDVKKNFFKVLEENIGRTLFDINHSKILFDPPPRVMKIITE